VARILFALAAAEDGRSVEELIQADGAEAIVQTLYDASGAPLIEIAGEVDMSNANVVRQAIDPVLENHPERIVFDLGELHFMDSSGLAVLLGVVERVPVVELRRPQPLIRRVIELTGLTDSFVITA
jgi:anti-sigma B factor antagonist